MSIYRVHFTWKKKEYTLKAESLDLTHPYFVSIQGLLLPKSRSLLVNIADNELRELFQDTRHLLIPFQSVSMIEEFAKDPDASEDANPEVIFMDNKDAQHDI